MEYRGKEICGLEVYNESDNNNVVAKVCDNSIECKNGYKVRILPYNEEVIRQQD